MADTMDIMSQVMHCQDDKMYSIQDAVLMTKQAFEQSKKEKMAPLIDPLSMANKIENQL